LFVLASLTASGIKIPIGAVPVRGAFDEIAPQDLEQFQGYLAPAPDGLDVWHAWSIPGGHGENVKIADIEFDWNLNHNDLKQAISNAFMSQLGTDPSPEFNVDHGTAVLGELIAAPDGVGVTGIAYGARIGLINPITQGSTPLVADAISSALKHLDPGDVIVLELQSVSGPRLDLTNGHGLVPIEFDSGVFDAIKTATQRGVTVVEAAANGFEDLDHPAYNGAFDRRNRDSGAIVVGAGNPPEGLYGPGPDRVRTEESNYGSRVDVQGWGRFVTTCGYGDLRHDQGKNNWYTTIFRGTSPATAMVAGAAAVLQSIAISQGLGPLSPLELRQLLVITGSPQQGDVSQNIGPRPNLKAAIEALDSFAGSDPRILAVKYKGASGKLVVDGANFVPRDSVIEIDGVAVNKIKYPAAYILPNGLTTRVQTKKSVSESVPKDIDVAITIFTPSTGQRSAPFLFRNQ
jgi:hypothetical protein